MVTARRQERPRVATVLVRVWSAVVLLASITATAALLQDWLHGEVIAHLGWTFVLSMAVLFVLAVGVIFLPLLMIAVYLTRSAHPTKRKG